MKADVWASDFRKMTPFLASQFILLLMGPDTLPALLEFLCVHEDNVEEGRLHTFQHVNVIYCCSQYYYHCCCPKRGKVHSLN